MVGGGSVGGVEYVRPFTLLLVLDQRLKHDRDGRPIGTRAGWHTAPVNIPFLLYLNWRPALLLLFAPLLNSNRHFTHSHAGLS
jgi:hypothetical protein